MRRAKADLQTPCPPTQYCSFPLLTVSTPFRLTGSGPAEKIRLIMLLWKPRAHDYRRLINFVNEPLDQNDWGARLKLADLWQAPDLPADANTWEQALNELRSPDWPLPTIWGSVADFAAAQALRQSLRKRLTTIADSRSAGESPERAWTARVFASGKVEFDDAADGLDYIAESLRREMKKGAHQYKGKRGRRWAMAALHLSTCNCGCGKFFLWEGNGIRRRRKFLNDEHRMKFHNARNVEEKKQLARRRRKEGRYQ